MWISISAALLLGSASPVAPPAGLPLGAPTSVQQDAPAPPMTPDKAQAEFLALEDEFEEAQQTFYGEINAKWEAHQAAGGDGSDFEMPDPIEPAFFPRFLALADAGVHAANGWVLMNYAHSGVQGEEAKRDKTQRLLTVLAGAPDDDVLNGLCGFLSGEAMSFPGEGDVDAKLGEEAAFAFLDVIRASAKTDEVKAMSLYSRGSAIRSKGYRDPEADVSEASAWFERAASEYPDTEMGTRCGGYVFAANHLQIGQVAPDIVGKDHDGNDIRRSDFEGKVTVLDFWGFW